MVITDMAGAYNDAMNVIDGLIAGNDLWLTPIANVWNVAGFETNASVMTGLRRAAHRILYVTANSNAMNGISPTMVIESVTPPFIYWLIILDVVLLIGAAVGSFFIIKYLTAKERETV